MKIVKASDKDKNEVKKLWQYCFTDTDEYTNYYFKNRYDKKSNYLIKEKDLLAASLMANPYKISINGNISDTSYIVGVSTSPVLRGRGYASTLMKYALKDRYIIGEDVSMLMPIDTAIYLRYGYANIADMLELDIPISRIKYTNQKDVYIKEYTEDKISDLIYIYEIYSKNFNAYFIRDEAYFRGFVQETYIEGGRIYIAYKNNNPIAYMLLYPKYKTGEMIFVKEIISLQKSAYDRLFEFLASHYTQADNIILNADKGSYIPYYFANDNKIIYKKKPFIMSRVLNVKSVLSKLQVQEKFLIHIKDDIIQENNHTFEVDKKNVSITEASCNLSMDIYDFTQLYFSYTSLDNILFKNSLKIQNNEYNNFKKVFSSKKDNYFNDYV